MSKKYDDFSFELLRLFGAPTEHCSKAVITLLPSSKPQIVATYNVVPFEIEGDEIKKVVRRFELVEKRED